MGGTTVDTCPTVFQQGGDQLLGVVQEDLLKTLSDKYVSIKDTPYYITKKQASELQSRVAGMPKEIARGKSRLDAALSTIEPVQADSVPADTVEQGSELQGMLQGMQTNMLGQVPVCVGSNDNEPGVTSPFGVSSWMCNLPTSDSAIKEALCTISRDLTIDDQGGSRPGVYAQNLLATHWAPIWMNGSCQVTEARLRAAVPAQCSCSLAADTCHARCKQAPGASSSAEACPLRGCYDLARCGQDRQGQLDLENCEPDGSDRLCGQ